MSGTGKTSVGTSAFNEKAIQWWEGRDLQRKNVKDGEPSIALWLNVGRFQRRYLEVASEMSEKAEWQCELSETSLLFIDDVDKLKPTAGLLELVYAVLDERLSSRRTTILTTNLSGKSLADRWGEEYGPYLVRRIRDFCLTVDFDLRNDPVSTGLS
jgi:gluconate kinase